MGFSELKKKAEEVGKYASGIMVICVDFKICKLCLLIA